MAGDGSDRDRKREKGRGFSWAVWSSRMCTISKESGDGRRTTTDGAPISAIGALAICPSRAVDMAAACAAPLLACDSDPDGGERGRRRAFWPVVGKGGEGRRRRFREGRNPGCRESFRVVRWIRAVANDGTCVEVSKWATTDATPYGSTGSSRMSIVYMSAEVGEKVGGRVDRLGRDLLGQRRRAEFSIAEPRLAGCEESKSQDAGIPKKASDARTSCTI